MNPSKPRIKFSDLLKLRRGDAVPDAANALPLEAVRATKDESLFDAFKAAEEGKWYGVLRGNGSKVNFVFRHGVCQSFTKTMQLYNHQFDMNIINDNVDFRKESK